MIKVESKERNNSGKPMNFLENDSLEIPTIFPPKLPDPNSFSILYAVGKPEKSKPYVTLVQASV